MEKLTQKGCSEKEKKNSDEMGSALEFEVSYLKPEEKCIEDEAVLFLPSSKKQGQV